jgi:SAM-dependent methyltransferase
MSEIQSLLTKPEFPRSSRYDQTWMLDNHIGPNALWLLEWLCQSLEVKPEMRILDLGCGRATTSIFLAREFGARVWAADLWHGPDNNWRRVVEAGVADRVCPMRVEAHALPFAQGFFDAVISIDAYQYFGTDELYLAYLSGFVRPGGIIGVVNAGLAQPIEGAAPPHLVEPQSNGKVFWEDGCWAFRTADWWRDLWSRCGCVADVKADLQPDGWRHWRDFERAIELAGKSVFPSYAEAIDRDHGRYLGFVRMTARRTEVPTMNMYDPSIGLRVGVDK